MILHPEIKIKQLRRIKNYSQGYIARRLGLSVRAYAEIEAGKTQLTITRLNDIGRILQMDPMEILGFDERQIYNSTEQGSYFCG